MQSRIKTLDFIVIVYFAINLYFWIEGFYSNIFLPNAEYGTIDYNPFYEYNNNKGIILIYTANTILIFGIVLIGIVWAIKRDIDYKWVYVIFIFCILLFISRWIEFWHGSTFYYGELRDKHGLTFPRIRLLLVFYAIWRYKLELINKKQIIIKVIVAILITLFFLGFYYVVYDIWRLGIS